jgi:hypothetical protein
MMSKIMVNIIDTTAPVSQLCSISYCAHTDPIHLRGSIPQSLACLFARSNCSLIRLPNEPCNLALSSEALLFPPVSCEPDF